MCTTIFALSIGPTSKLYVLALTPRLSGGTGELKRLQNRFLGKPLNGPHFSVSYIFDRLLKCLYFSDKDGNEVMEFFDFLKHDRDWDNMKRRAKYYESDIHFSMKNRDFDYVKFSLANGHLELRMRYPEKFLKNASKVALRETFPYNIIRVFNNESSNLRNIFGRPMFKFSCRDNYNLKCQHRVANKSQLT